MKIVATDKPLRVDYKKNGKFYNVNPTSEGQVPQNSDTHSDYAFDSQELAPGQEFDQTDVEVLRVTELGINSGPGETPVAP